MRASNIVFEDQEVSQAVLSRCVTVLKKWDYQSLTLEIGRRNPERHMNFLESSEADAFFLTALQAELADRL